MDIKLLTEGCYIMAIGMGTVFLFLVLMIYAMNFMSWFIKKINKYFPEEIIEQKSLRKSQQKNDDAEIAVAIASALHFQNR